MSNTDPNSQPSENNPPDWDTHSTDLLCPLCGYNLRHLTVARCPECGFAFQWRELLEAEKNKHKYIFEHGAGHNLKTFWKTYWTTCRPGKFWSDLNPAQPVRLMRLMIYWLLSTCVVGICLADSNTTQVLVTARNNILLRQRIRPAMVLPGKMAQVRILYPLPWEMQFWSQIFSSPRMPYGGGYRYYSGYRRHGPPGVGWAIFLLLWPWLTLVTLLIFRMSMRQAKIRTIHILRTVLYSCDFGLLLAAALMVVMFTAVRAADGWLLLGGAVVCALITTYRLTIAFKKYLRVHLPLATVLATQVIVVLAVFVVLVPVADF